MNFCSNCGKKIVDNNNFCTGCGTRLNDYNSVNLSIKKEENNGLKTASIVLGIIGIVGSLRFILSPLTLITSLVGLILGIVASKEVRNVSGIVLNSVGLFLSIIMLGIIVIFILMVTDTTSEYIGTDYYYDDSYFDDFYSEYFDNGSKEYY